MTSKNLFTLEGKVAVITGGSRGLGREMAIAFAEHGADIVVASRKVENCEIVAEEVRALGRRALAVGYHAASWADAERLRQNKQHGLQVSRTAFQASCKHQQAETLATRTKQ